MKLKPIADQVGLLSERPAELDVRRRFAQRGAKVVVAARSEPGLISLVHEITEAGGQGAYAVCDVVNVDQVNKVAETAIQSFGRIDTWVNVAAVSVYARFEETTPEEFRRVAGDQLSRADQRGFGGISAFARSRARRSDLQFHRWKASCRCLRTVPTVPRNKPSKGPSMRCAGS